MILHMNIKNNFIICKIFICDNKSYLQRQWKY